MPFTPRDLAAYHRCALIHSRRLSSSRQRRMPSAGICTGSVTGRLVELKPVEATRRQGQQIRKLADAREPGPAEQLDRMTSLECTQVELDGLRRAGEVVHAEHE